MEFKKLFMIIYWELDSFFFIWGGWKRGVGIDSKVRSCIVKRRGKGGKKPKP
jgi:hypothetical protein